MGRAAAVSRRVLLLFISRTEQLQFMCRAVCRAALLDL